MIGSNRKNNHFDGSLSAPASIQTPIIPFPLSFESINSLEEEFDIYEIVSLVFLLYDNADTALQQLTVAKVTVNETGTQVSLISDWVRNVRDKNLKWQETLLEALTNVQCYKALKKLGFTKVEMNERFLPLNYECTINLHPVKKALYRLCEDLSKDVIEILIENVQRDLLEHRHLQATHSIFSIDKKYLEMHILYWITKRYIHISYDNTNDLKNLINVLEESNIVSSRLLGMRLQNSVTRANTMYEQLLLVTSLQKKLVFDRNKENSDSMMSVCSHNDIPETKRYEMNRQMAGLVIIINQKNFKGDLENRLGTDSDRDRLIEVWKMYGFKVVVYEDLCYIDILIKIKESILKDFDPRFCCLVVTILSHGKKDVIFGVDGKELQIELIKSRIKSIQKLLGKPKILMIQACQGNMKANAITLSNKTVENNGTETDDDNEINLTVDCPSSKKEERTAMENADFCEITSTTPGYVSVRDTIKGSWLIQTFCDVLKEDGAREHFESILLITKNKINEKRWSGTGMVPSVTSTLNKLLYFVK